MDARTGLSLKIRSPHLDGESDFVYDTDFLLNVGCDFEMSIDDCVVMREPDFTFFELAVHLADWQRIPRVTRGNFEFESLEAQEPDLIWFRRRGGHWRVGSAWQIAVSEHALSLKSIDAECDRFITEAIHVTQELTGQEVARWFPELASRARN